jgi:hypothetical protein
VNDPDRLGRDPATRWIVGGKAFESGGASTSQIWRFETELLTIDENLEHFLTGLNRRGFPDRDISDSRCGLVKEASLHDQTSFE